MTLMAQREFYFPKGFSWVARHSYCKRNFMILFQFRYAAGKTIFVDGSAFSKNYSLKEQTWLATYERGYPRKAEVEPTAFILT